MKRSTTSNSATKKLYDKIKKTAAQLEKMIEQVKKLKAKEQPKKIGKQKSKKSPAKKRSVKKAKNPTSARKAKKRSK